MTTKSINKEHILTETAELQKKLYDLLYLMFADGKHSLLIILQGIDTCGKDGVVRHLFESANPQGLKVYSFKSPSEEELHHDFLWRCHKVAPEAGHAVIFNRSYYEEVTTVQVNPSLLKNQQLPQNVIQDRNIFKKRYEHIRNFEKMLNDQGTVVVKFLLDISKDEQKARLTKRLKDPSKNWKFSTSDLKARKSWDKYMAVFKKMVKNTSTPRAPWHVIPADKKWYRNYLVTKILVETLSKLDMRFPKIQTDKTS
jgi:PPK2 family polyphosphate:nucleotide phosphotransferase